MVQVSLSTSTTFDGDQNALVEDQGTELTLRFDLDEAAPTGGLRIFVDSDVVQILNRLNLPAFAFNPQLENINIASFTSDFDNSGFALTIDAGATFGSFTIPIFDNPEPDTFLPETFDGLVETTFELKTQDGVPDDGSNITGISDYTLDPAATSSVVLFADDVSQLPSTTPTPTPNPTPTPTPGPSPTPTPGPSPTPTPTGDPPVVSFETVPANYSEESENNLVEWRWTVTGDLPEDGIVVNFESVGDNDINLFTEQFAATPPAEFVNAEIADFAIDPDTGLLDELDILITAPEASFNLYILNDILEEGDQTFDFRIVDGEGYTVDPDQNSTLFTISDDNGGPGVGPTVGVSVSDTDLAEGDPLTVTFTVDDDIPAEGVQILVQSDVPGSLGQFDLADLGNIATTGISGLPAVGDGGGGSFFVTIVEPTATINLNVFDDILAEEPLDITFTIANGEEYEVDAATASAMLTISDEAQPAGPTVGISVDQATLIEGGDALTLTISVTGEIPAEGLPILINDVTSAGNQSRSLTEFDVANVQLTGIDGFPTPADGDSGFFVTVTEPTATITLAAFDEGADEDEAQESFNFAVIDGEAYEVDPDASDVTINIVDAADNTSLPILSFTAEPTTLNEEEGTSLVLNFAVEGEFPEEGVIVRFDENFFDTGDQIDFNVFELENLEFFDFEETSPGRFTIDYLLSAPEGSLTTAVFDDNVAEDEFIYNPAILPIPDANYTINPDASSVSISVIDGVEGTGGPIVSLSVDKTELSEGDSLTITLTAEGELPEGGLEVFVDSDTGAVLGEFITIDENGIPNAALTGIEGLPAPDGDASGFTVTMVENTATISINSVFDDGPTEGPEVFEFSVADGENYDIDADTNAVSITLNDGGEDAAFDVTSGVTSVFLDFPLLEEAAGLTLVGADSDVDPFSEDFQVGFAITDDTDFSFAPVPFTPLGGSIEHSGTITLGLGDAEATIGEFSIGFDADRISDTASGFFVADTLDDALGLEVLFDLSAPGTAVVSRDTLEISDADLLLSPELAGALGLDDLAGTDVGDARIDAMVALTDDAFDSVLMGTSGEDRLIGTKGDDLFDGGLGQDKYIGGKGADTFVIRPGEGLDTIRDFHLWEGDKIALGGGLSFNDLTISRFGRDGARLSFAGEDLAIVQANRFGAINESAFTTV